LNLQWDAQSKAQAKRSSSETLLERSAPDADRNGILIEHAKILPGLISDLLRSGKRVRFRAPGYSMYPTILNGDEITVEPIKPDAIKVGDIILYRDQESLIAYRVVKKEIQKEISNDAQSSVLSAQSYYILRGDARPACDDPVAAEQVLGKVLRIETNGRGINPYSFKAKIIFIARRLVFRLKRFMN
jgi:signal peptidase I